MVAEQFRANGIEYQAAEKPKSDLYLDLLPLLNSGMIDLLDHPRAVAQLAALERRTTRSGKDSIDHPAGGHDDLANAVAGAAAWRTKPVPWAGTLEWMRRQCEAPIVPVVRAQTGVQRPDGVPASHVRVELIGELQPSHYYAASGAVSMVLRDTVGSPYLWLGQDDARAMLNGRYAAPALREANAALMAELAQ